MWHAATSLGGLRLPEDAGCPCMDTSYLHECLDKMTCLWGPPSDSAACWSTLAATTGSTRSVFWSDRTRSCKDDRASVSQHELAVTPGHGDGCQEGHSETSHPGQKHLLGAYVIALTTQSLVAPSSMQTSEGKAACVVNRLQCAPDGCPALHSQGVKG